MLLATRNTQSLGSRMVLATLAFCLVFTLGAVAVKTWLAWMDDVTAMRAELLLVARIYDHTLTKAIWELDRESVQSHLASSRAVPAIGRAVITINHDQQPPEILTLTRPGWQPSAYAPVENLPLGYQTFAGAAPQRVGSLLLYGDERVLWSRLKGEITNIIITQVIQSLLLASFIMLIFNRSVTVHVQRIARHLQALTPQTLGERLRLQRKQPLNDELATLVAGVNQLQHNLSDYLLQKQQYESELAAHRDHLSELVEARTVELSVANDALAHSAETLRQLGDIGKDLTASLNPQAICQSLHQHLEALMPLDAFAVAMRTATPDQLELVYCVADGRSAEPAALRLDPEAALIARAFLASSEAMLVDETTLQTSPLGIANLPPEPMREAILRPLSVHGQRLGVVIVLSHVPHVYHEREQDIVRSIGAYAAIALGNASAYAAAEAARQQADQALIEVRQAQGQLIHSEKMAALGQLVAGVAHEINTPIGAVKSSGRNILDALDHALQSLPAALTQLEPAQRVLFLQLLDLSRQPGQVINTREERAISRDLALRLAQHGIADARQRASVLVQLKVHDDVERFLPLLQHPQCSQILETAYSISAIVMNAVNINVAVERVTKIIFALKTFSRFDAEGELCESDLREGLEMVLTIYQNKIKQGTEIVRHFREIPPVRCLPDQLNQVWTNLVSNALQAMNYKGTLTLGIDVAGEYVVVSIADTGSGMAPEVRERIFEPFFTTKPAGEGTGLGLDIVRKIVERHRGRIEVDSTPGQGSTFRVYLPWGEAT
ncbi:ATP-binding protein [Paludibacterium sp. B53371]|uniref:GAF domain-containing sensor histidine kinase n=1 Tax=Paludibacterium sp. B53371 TaxID=2806263 RepID=UPI001C044281|nr:ATP-binding protein [Paludibacterium sp. B53371]